MILTDRKATDHQVNIFLTWHDHSASPQVWGRSPAGVVKCVQAKTTFGQKRNTHATFTPKSEPPTQEPALKQDNSYAFIRVRALAIFIQPWARRRRRATRCIPALRCAKKVKAALTLTVRKRTGEISSKRPLETSPDGRQRPCPPPPCEHCAVPPEIGAPKYRSVGKH